MSIKMESELRDQFMAVAASRHRPAAQIIRDLMRLYIAQSETPNELTADTIRKARRGEDVFHAKDAEDLLLIAASATAWHYSGFTSPQHRSLGLQRFLQWR